MAWQGVTHRLRQVAAAVATALTPDPATPGPAPHPATGSPHVQRRVTPGPAPGPPGWDRLPPVPPALPVMRLAAPSSAFEQTLTTRHDPRFIQRLGHLRAPQAPAGQILTSTAPMADPDRLPLLGPAQPARTIQRQRAPQLITPGPGTAVRAAASQEVPNAPSFLPGEGSDSAGPDTAGAELHDVTAGSEAPAAATEPVAAGVPAAGPPAGEPADSQDAWRCVEEPAPVDEPAPAEEPPDVGVPPADEPPGVRTENSSSTAAPAAVPVPLLAQRQTGPVEVSGVRDAAQASSSVRTAPPGTPPVPVPTGAGPVQRLPRDQTPSRGPVAGHPGRDIPDAAGVSGEHRPTTSTQTHLTTGTPDHLTGELPTVARTLDASAAEPAGPLPAARELPGTSRPHSRPEPPSAPTSAAAAGSPAPDLLVPPSPGPGAFPPAQAQQVARPTQAVQRQADPGPRSGPAMVAVPHHEPEAVLPVPQGMDVAGGTGRATTEEEGVRPTADLPGPLPPGEGETVQVLPLLASPGGEPDGSPEQTEASPSDAPAALQTPPAPAHTPTAPDRDLPVSRDLAAGQGPTVSRGLPVDQAPAAVREAPVVSRITGPPPVTPGPASVPGLRGDGAQPAGPATAPDPVPGGDLGAAADDLREPASSAPLGSWPTEPDVRAVADRTPGSPPPAEESGADLVVQTLPAAHPPGTAPAGGPPDSGIVGVRQVQRTLPADPPPPLPRPVVSPFVAALAGAGPGEPAGVLDIPTDQLSAAPARTAVPAAVPAPAAAPTGAAAPALPVAQRFLSPTGQTPGTGPGPAGVQRSPAPGEAGPGPVPNGRVTDLPTMGAGTFPGAWAAPHGPGGDTGGPRSADQAMPVSWSLESGFSSPPQSTPPLHAVRGGQGFPDAAPLPTVARQVVDDRPTAGGARMPARPVGAPRAQGPTVQRAPEQEAPQPTVQADAADPGPGAPAPTGTPSPAGQAASVTAVPPPGPPGSGTPDLEELARRLYEPLLALVRAELWLDRERAGMVCDPRR